MTGTSARVRRAVAACLLAVAVAGCASSPSGGTAANTSTTAAAASTASTAAGSPTTGTATSATVITIKNFVYQTPASVSPGATVTVRNEDSTEHTVTADSGNAFDDQVPSGGTSTFTAPMQPGSYPFHCTIHPFMKGTLVVR